MDVFKPWRINWVIKDYNIFRINIDLIKVLVILDFILFKFDFILFVRGAYGASTYCCGILIENED